MNVLGFEFPDELHYAVDDQVWARPDGEGQATVGITSLGIGVSGEIYMCRPKPVGSEVARGRSIAVVELAKSIVSVKSPVGGTVVAVNPRLGERPELVHLDPYGEGWLATLQLADFAADAAALVYGAAVRDAMTRYARLYRIDGTA